MWREPFGAVNSPLFYRLNYARITALVIYLKSAQVKDFLNMFPKNAPEFTTDKPELSVIEILQIGVPTESKTELRRLVLQNAVTINDEKATDVNQVLTTNEPLFVRVGRKTFFKIAKK